MTYNFDPDAWYDNERAMLRKRLADAAISQDEYEDALATLEKRLETMWNRLDGAYRIPGLNR